MKSFNTPWTEGLLAFLTVYFGLHYLKPEFPEFLLLLYGVGISFITGVIRYLTRPIPSKMRCHPDLPEAAMRALQESLHHSQMTMYFTIIQPMLVRSFPSLVTEIIGKKPNEAPLTRFDEKIERLKYAFRQLATSGSLYNKRALEDRDRALTMLVFLRILWRELSAGDLPARLKTIPVALYPMLRGEAYRLYDLVLLFTNGQVLANKKESMLLAGIEGFFPDSSSNASETPLTAETGRDVQDFLVPRVTLVDEIQPMRDAFSSIEPALLSTDSVTEGACLADFLSWLLNRIASGNKQFALEYQALLVCNKAHFGANTIFLLPDVLAKYQSRSGVASIVLESALKDAFSDSKSFFIERDGQRIVVLPCALNEAFSTDNSTEILEGVTV